MGTRCSKTTSLQVCIGQVVPSPIIGRDDDASQRRLRSGVCLDFEHREVFAQAAPDINLAPDVAPQIRPR